MPESTLSPPPVRDCEFGYWFLISSWNKKKITLQGVLERFSYFLYLEKGRQDLGTQGYCTHNNPIQKCGNVFIVILLTHLCSADTYHANT
jgi:hypothetical protein